MTSVFMSPKAALDFVDHAGLQRCFSRNGVPKNLFPLYTNSQRWAHAYGDLSRGFTTKSATFQEGSLPLFIISFCAEMITKISLWSCKNTGIYICPGIKLSDLQRAHIVVLPSENPRKFYRPSEEQCSFFWEAFCALQVWKAVSGLNWLEDEPCSCRRRIGWSSISPGGRISACLFVCRMCDWDSPIWGICDVNATPDYQPTVEFTLWAATSISLQVSEAWLLMTCVKTFSIRMRFSS